MSETGESHSQKTLQPDEVRIPADSIWARFPVIFGAIGLVGLVLAVVLGGREAESFYASYLVAFVFVLSIGLGGLFFVMVHYITRAGWSVLVRRLAENAAMCLSVLALLALPLIFIGVDELYHWAHFEHELHEAEEAVAGLSPEALEAAVVASDLTTPEELLDSDPILAGKLPFLNTGFWRVRAVFYLAVWILLAWYFRRRSVAQDESGDKRVTRRLQGAAAPGLIAFALTLTFAAFDWLMSLDSHWYSTIFGVYFFAGCLISIYAFLSVMGISLRRSGILSRVISAEHYHDLGKLLFAFTVFWTYIAFSQYMLYWYANMAETTLWFHHRWVGDWKIVSLIIGLGHFAVPFFFLMSRHIKRRPGLLLAGSLWMLLMHLVDMYWVVMPNFYETGPVFGIVDVLLVVGMGSLFLGAFTWFLRRDAMVPVRDPRLPESLAFENF